MLFGRIEDINFSNRELWLVAVGFLSILSALNYPDQAHYLLLVLSFLLTASGILGLLPYYVAKRWVRQEAIFSYVREVMEEVKSGHCSRRVYRYPVVEYSYQLGGSGYRNSCVSFEKQNIWTTGYNIWGDRLPEEGKLWSTWSPETKIEVYVNPRRPHQSVLLPRLTKCRFYHHMALIVSGGLVCLSWAMFRLLM